SGSSSATTGSPTASSDPMTTSSITAALPGTASSTSRGQSCPSACAIGHIGPDQRDLVLRLISVYEPPTALVCPPARPDTRPVAAIRLPSTLNNSPQRPSPA